MFSTPMHLSSTQMHLLKCIWTLCVDRKNIIYQVTSPVL